MKVKLSAHKFYEVYFTGPAILLVKLRQLEITFLTSTGHIGRSQEHDQQYVDKELRHREGD